VEVRIDTLRLQVAGMSPDTASEFGRLVAERLGAALAALPAASGPARFAGLRVTVPAPPEASPGTLATTTATEISRALRRGVTR
jgi:hypothetical protein